MKTLLLMVAATAVALAQTPGSTQYPEMTLIPGGEFQMGDHAGFVDPQHPSDEIPVHKVWVDSFYIGTYDVTNRQYIEFLNSAWAQGLIEVRSGVVYRKGSNDAYCDTRQSAEWSSIAWSGSEFSLADTRGAHAVVGMRWFGAAAYANWLSARLGLQACYDASSAWKCDFTKNGYRLPTEAEWEYAARGGQYNPYYVYPWGNDADAARANWPITPANPYQTGSYPWTTPVGFFNGELRQKADFGWPGTAATYQTKSGANAYGLHDMAGNVWQWIHDWYQSAYYTSSSYKNPTGPESGTIMPDGVAYRGMRGGNWYNGDQTDPGHARVSNRDPGYYRGPQDPNHPYYHVGFRVARGAQAAGTTMARLPGTGQTGNFTSTFGEDSDYQLSPPAFQAKADGTVTDMVTGLTWQQSDGGEMTWENASSYCKALSLGGFRDWRLPFAHESFSILNHNWVNPALDAKYFTKTAAEYWWTSEQRADDAARIWVTNAGGGIGPHPKSETIGAGGGKRIHARCVRGAVTVTSPRASLTDNGDGTITDNHTGLIWQKADAGSALNWEDALKYAEGLTLAGYSDWRLPNIKELESINDESLTSPSLDKTLFGGALPGEYWSATTQVNNSASAWTVDFTYGIASYRTKTEAIRVRAVRGGFAALAVVSAASYATDYVVAPASIASGFGDLRALAKSADATLTVLDSAGASYSAQVLAAAPVQVNFVTPAEAASGVATVTVSAGGRQIAAGVVNLDSVAPGLFSANSDGRGVAAAVALTVAADGKRTWKTIFDETAPGGSRSAVAIDVSRPGEQVYLLAFGTGMRNAKTAIATVGGVPVGIAGPVVQGVFAGLDQVNLGPLPASLAGRGEVEIALTVDGKAANAATVSFK